MIRRALAAIVRRWRGSEDGIETQDEPCDLTDVPARLSAPLHPTSVVTLADGTAWPILNAPRSPNSNDVS